MVKQSDNNSISDRWATRTIRSGNWGILPQEMSPLIKDHHVIICVDLDYISMQSIGWEPSCNTNVLHSVYVMP